MHVAFEPMRGERISPEVTIPADEAVAGWVLVGRAALTPSIPGSRVMHALVFRTPEGDYQAVFLDKTTYQFRAWPIEL